MEDNLGLLGGLTMPSTVVGKVFVDMFCNELDGYLFTASQLATHHQHYHSILETFNVIHDGIRRMEEVGKWCKLDGMLSMWKRRCDDVAEDHNGIWSYVFNTWLKVLNVMANDGNYGCDGGDKERVMKKHLEDAMRLDVDGLMKRKCRAIANAAITNRDTITITTASSSTSSSMDDCCYGVCADVWDEPLNESLIRFLERE